MKSIKRFSLSRKIAVGIVPLFLVFVTASVILQNHFQEVEMVRQAQVTAYVYADIIKEAMVSMMVNNLEVDEGFLEQVNKLAQFDTLHILVNELKLRPDVVPPEKMKRVATEHKTLVPHDDVERKAMETGTPFFSTQGERFRGVIPFNATKKCQECHAVPLGYTLGAADLHISFSQVAAAAEGNWRRSLFIFLIFAVLAMIVATIGFRKIISQPTNKLIDAANQIQQGNLDHSVALDPVGGNTTDDELHYLADRFEDMRLSLKEKIEQLDDLNRSLSQRNNELENALAQLQQAQDDLIKMERLAVTGKMTAQLSHEINNPVHNIQSLLQTSLRKLAGGQPKVQELLSVALEEIERMAKLTRQMLDVYRGSMTEIRREPMSVQALLTEVAELNAPILQEAGITIQCDLLKKNLTMLCSRDKMRQIFLNLILNAKDAMPKGGTITLRAREEGTKVCMEVIDQGRGIPVEHLDKIFDAFYSTKEELRGAGLGLFVTYGLVQQHGGTINVRSEVGRGSVFTITMEAAYDAVQS